MQEYLCDGCERLTDENCRYCRYFVVGKTLTEEERTEKLLKTCSSFPATYNKMNNILYDILGKPSGAELCLLVTYCYITIENGRVKK